VTRDERLGRDVGTASIWSGLSLSQQGDPLEVVRAYRQRQSCAFLARRSRWTDLTMLFREQSDLAKLSYFRERSARRKDLTIIAMGKFGGHEIVWRRFDVLFVGSESGAAQKLLAALVRRARKEASRDSTRDCARWRRVLLLQSR